jgi:hypothetical protein
MERTIHPDLHQITGVYQEACSSSSSGSAAGQIASDFENLSEILPLENELPKLNRRLML